MEKDMIRGWDLSSPGAAGSSDLGWGIHTVRGGIDPGNLRFRFRFVGVVDVLEL